MACECELTTCGWRENGGTCADCKIKAQIEECNCPLQIKKKRFDVWLLLNRKLDDEECDCGCGG